MGTENGNLNYAPTEMVVAGQTSSGAEIHGKLLRVTRYAAVFELHSPELVLRVSEKFESLKIIGRGRTLYSGGAVVKSLIDAGSVATCELKLNEDAWLDLNLSSGEFLNGTLKSEFQNFVTEWQNLYKVLPEYKLAVADMQSFLSDLKLWLDQVELNLRSQPTGDASGLERHVLQSLSEAALPSLGMLFERFEHIAPSVEKDLQPSHALYAKRLIHPLVLCSPFMYRTFRKPLGYAGDYEMVNMMTADSFQGASIFAKVLNTFFLNTPPVVAHRNRITFLKEMLMREVAKGARSGKPVRILNLGCGPALEIQAFMEASPLSSRADFTLLDFNDETVGYTTRLLSEVKQRFARDTGIRVLKKSVAQLLKDQAKPVPTFNTAGYDLVYCAGLFDYLADPICARLVDVFYQMVSPGGLVVVTNVDVSNPSRGWMEYMVDWHLCYRNSKDMFAIMPRSAPPEAVNVFSEPIGVNIFAEVRKPRDA